MTWSFMQHFSIYIILEVFLLFRNRCEDWRIDRQIWMFVNTFKCLLLFLNKPLFPQHYFMVKNVLNLRHMLVTIINEIFNPILKIIIIIFWFYIFRCCCCFHLTNCQSCMDNSLWVIVLTIFFYCLMKL